MTDIIKTLPTFIAGRSLDWWRRPIRLDDPGLVQVACQHDYADVGESRQLCTRAESGILRNPWDMSMQGHTTCSSYKPEQSSVEIGLTLGALRA